MTQSNNGFSLAELLIALALASGLCTMMFQLFHQNERAIRDQTLIMEMQQTARVVAAQIADEIRMAGQGVPVYAASFDAMPSEATAVILGSSTASRIDFRAGLSNTETGASVGAVDLTLGSSTMLSLANTSGFAVEKFAYVFGPSTNSSWPWVRAELTGVSSTFVTLTPRNTGTANTTVHLGAPPTVAMEEAVSIYLGNGSVRRAMASSFTNPAAPAWGPANEIGKNFIVLSFTYYDAVGNHVQPTSLANRMSIARIDIQLTVETAAPLSNGTRPTYSLSLRTIPRNAQVRWAN
jgi:prepilin-type N-terminal cleavage/methylation domain-containing protein